MCVSKQKRSRAENNHESGTAKLPALTASAAHRESFSPSHAVAALGTVSVGKVVKEEDDTDVSLGKAHEQSARTKCTNKVHEHTRHAGYSKQET